MAWLHPTYAWMGLLVLGAGGLVAWRVWRGRNDRARFGDVALVRELAAHVHPRRRVVRYGLVLMALTLFVVALAGPRVGTKTRTVERKGVDLVIALDVSQSMQAQDVAPSRLERAKREVGRLIGDLSGDRVGLVLFAGDGFVQAPLTTDYDAIRLFLDVAAPDLMPTPGTNFRAAFDAALQAFDDARAPGDTTAAPDAAPRSRALLIVSDGENHQGDLEAIRSDAQEARLRLFSAGVGTTGGATIPVYRNGRKVGVKTDAQGQTVRTRLQPDALQALAQGGAYFPIAQTSSSLGDFKDALSQLERTAFDAAQFEEYAEMFQWPLALGLLLLGASMLIPVRTPSGARSMLPGIEQLRAWIGRGAAPDHRPASATSSASVASSQEDPQA